MHSMNSILGRKAKRLRVSIFLVAAVLMILIVFAGIGVTYYLVTKSRSLEESKGRAQFEANAAVLFQTLAVRVQELVNRLSLGAGFVSAAFTYGSNRSIAEPEFAWFARTVKAVTPGATLQYFAQYVPGDNRSDFEGVYGPIMDVGPSNSTSSGTLQPAGMRPEYFVTQFVVPRSRPGMIDILVFPGRADIYGGAKQTGQTTMSPIMQILVNAAPAAGVYLPGVLLATPVYRFGTTDDFIGVIGNIVTLADLGSNMTGGDSLAYTVTDVTTNASAAPFLYSDVNCTRVQCSAGTHAETNITVGGRVWALHAVAKTAFLDSFTSELPLVFLGVGIVCIFLLIVLLFVMFHLQSMESSKKSLEAAAQAHSWLLNYVCHEIRNPLHGANFIVTSHLASSEDRVDARAAQVAVPGIPNFDLDLLVDTLPPQAHSQAVAHYSCPITESVTVHNVPPAATASMHSGGGTGSHTSVQDREIPAAAHGIDSRTELQEDLAQLDQFMMHMCRAVDDALLCQQLAVGSYKPAPARPTNVRQLVSDRILATMSYFASGVSVAVRAAASVPNRPALLLDADSLDLALQYALLHVAKHTIAGSVHLDGRVDRKSSDGLYRLTIDIAFTGSYAHGATEAVRADVLPLKHLVEASNTAPVLRYEANSKRRGSCMSHPSDPTRSGSVTVDGNGHGLHPDAASMTSDVLFQAVLDTRSPRADSGTRLCLSICDGIMSAVNGSMDLRHVPASASANGSLSSCYCLTLSMPVGVIAATSLPVLSITTLRHGPRSNYSAPVAEKKVENQPATECIPTVPPNATAAPSSAASTPAHHAASPRTAAVLPLYDDTAADSKPIHVQGEAVLVSPPAASVAGEAKSESHEAVAVSFGDVSVSVACSADVLSAAHGGTVGPEKLGLAATVFRSVIVVDDEATNRKVAERMLQRMIRTGSSILAPDAGIICLADGTELDGALAGLSADQLPVCVLLDIWMPHSDGVSVCSALRARGSCIPVLAMTAHVDVASISTYEAAGFNGVLGKPFSQAVMQSTLTQLTAMPTPSWINFSR